LYSTYTPQPQANSKEDLTQETGSQAGNKIHMECPSRHAAGPWWPSRSEENEGGWRERMFWQSCWWMA